MKKDPETENNLVTENNPDMKEMFRTAMILAGGKSSRMGFDKQLLELDHKTLAVRMAEELLKHFERVIVVTKTPELYEHVDVITCSDIYPGQGPISGIHAAFRQSDAEVLFVVACDMTGFSRVYARHQAERMLKERTEACVTMNGEKMEPFHGFFSRSLLPDLEQRLTDPQAPKSLYHLLKNHAVTEIGLEEMRGYADPEGIFTNLNTPQDYQVFQENHCRTPHSDNLN